MAAAASGNSMEALLPVVERLADLLAFASFVPVLLSYRLSTGQRRRRPRKNQENNAPLSAYVGVGLVCLVLLLLSEIFGSWEFVKLMLKGGQGKLATKLQALLQSIKEGASKTKMKSTSGMVEKAATVVILTLNSDLGYDVATSFVAIVAILIAMVCSLISGVRRLVDESSARRNATLAVGILWPLGAFCYFYKEDLKKAALAVPSDGLPEILQLVFRVAALILANRREGSTPTGFAALQAASLLASVQAVLLKGTLVGSYTAAQKQGFAEFLLSNPMFTSTIFPSALAIAWLYVCHMSDSLTAITLCAVATAISSPPILAWGMPQAQLLLGLSSKSAGPALLTEIVSLLYMGTTVLIVITGGTQSVLVITLLGQALVQFTGTGPFMEILEVFK
mmetsp:Transcript_19899/g.43209  ORF Transcript_19899/g.43209 Transcript_19899/m.43209 type:complete len:394 (-) Transcript_19899:261-1442(-)